MESANNKSPKTSKPMVLFLAHDDPQKELEFEVKFALTLTEAQRYEEMLDLMNKGLQMLYPHGRTKPPSVFARS